jgi:hypothetical protein
MILYNASTSDGLRNMTRFLTNSDTSSYANADLDAAINRYNRLFVNKIIEAMDGWDFQGEIATTDLVANQQEYVFPTDILKFKRAEISYDGTTWRRMDLIDVNNKPRQTDSTTINNEYSTYDPQVDLFDKSLFVYPIPTADVTGGLKIWYEKEASDLTAATDEPVFLEAYHPGLAYGAAVDYLSKYQEVEFNSSKLRDNQEKLNRLILDMQSFYRRRTQDQDYTVQGVYVDYDYGSDY